MFPSLVVAGTAGKSRLTDPILASDRRQDALSCFGMARASSFVLPDRALQLETQWGAFLSSFKHLSFLCLDAAHSVPLPSLQLYHCDNPSPELAKSHKLDQAWATMTMRYAPHRSKKICYRSEPPPAANQTDCICFCTGDRNPTAALHRGATRRLELSAPWSKLSAVPVSKMPVILRESRPQLQSFFLLRESLNVVMCGWLPTFACD